MGSLKLSENEYRSIDALNYSTLKLLRDSNTPAHFKWQLDHPRPATEEMVLGSAIHTVLLEPNEFMKRFVVAPSVNRRTKEGKEQYEAFLKENEGKAVISEDEHETCMIISAQVEENEPLKELLQSLKKEEVLLWEEGRTKCKARLDGLSQENNIIIDIKTTKCAKPEAFMHSVIEYAYYLQAAHYISGVRTVYDTECEFYFIAIDKTQPHGIAVHKLSDDFLKIGFIERDRLMKQYEILKYTENYASYPQEVNVIEVPEFFKRKFL